MKPTFFTPVIISIITLSCVVSTGFTSTAYADDDTSPSSTPTATQTATASPSEIAARNASKTANRNAYDALKSVVFGKDSNTVNGWNSSAVFSNAKLTAFKKARNSAITLMKTQWYASSTATKADIDGNTTALKSMLATVSTTLDNALNSHEDKKGQLAMPALKNLLKTANALVSSSHNKVADNKTRIRLANQVKSSTSYSKTSTPRVNQINAHKNALNVLMSRVNASETQLARAKAAAAARAKYIRSIKVVKRVNSTLNCSPSKSDPVCQKAVNTGRLVKITFYNGRTIDYAQHNSTGGNWINGLHNGQGVIVNNVLYVVHDQAVGQTTAPSSGVYLQTCTASQGIRLVHLVRP